MKPTHSLARLFGSLSLLQTPASRVTNSMATTSVRSFSSTAVALARKAPPKAGKGGKVTGKAAKTQTASKRRRAKPTGLTESAKRIRTLKQNMFSPAPPPLRMARQRHLRHWTIHRAWQLFRRQQNEALHKERSRMQAGMWNACEALREATGPGERGEGYLYRVAMEKKGLWHGDAIPIEYARMQTESPAEVAWNHDWKR